MPDMYVQAIVLLIYASLALIIKKFIFHRWKSFPLENSIKLCFHRWNLSPNIIPSMENIYPHFSIGGTKHIQRNTVFSKSFQALEPHQNHVSIDGSAPSTCSKRQKRCLKVQNMFPSMVTYPRQID